MKITYTLFHQYIVYVLLMSLCLQSCDGIINPISPITEDQASFPKINIGALANKQLAAQGGQQITFYEYKGNLQASVELSDRKSVV